MNLDAAFLARGAALGALLLHSAAEFALEAQNHRWLLGQRKGPGESWSGFIDDAAWAKMVTYQLAKSRLARGEAVWDLVIRSCLLFSGVMPWLFERVTAVIGWSIWSLAGYIYFVAALVSVWDWPLDYYRRFRLEQQFGFNTMTAGLWWQDRVKSLGLGVLLGLPLLAGLLFLVHQAEKTWWLWGWFLFFFFQLLMVVLAPLLIFPLFNRFQPLPEGSLRERLIALAEHLRFPVRQILVMDGSKRSRHSNAFFTGFGRFRRIVLFDTLISELTEPEVEAVVAHEIGHARLGHIFRMLAGSGAGLLAGFYAVFWLSQQSWFYQAFGFERVHPAAAFLLCGLLGGAITFWGLPLLHGWSRRHEFAADAYAVRVVGGSKALMSALIKLHEKNLSQVLPHPLYRWVYYAHPALEERLQALAWEDRCLESKNLN
jgi:STE24 endopeptidase